MDLGCLDMGCIEKKQSNQTSPPPSDISPNGSATASTKFGKNKGAKETGQSSLVALNKFTSQIRKPPHRKNSPLNWFPRKKVDSYLKRKIKLLQEGDGMNLTLDETLGDSNPHYSRVLREKIAVREAAVRAMEARKAAMVEASWCRILQTARIGSKDAEEQLLETEKCAAEAFEAATAIGLTMYDIPGCPQKHYKIETSSAKGGFNTHTITASFETAFEVDKQVAAAVKKALIKLANCSSIKENVFKDLLHKISEHPDTDENNQESLEISSECESDNGLETEFGSNRDDFDPQDLNHGKELVGLRQRNYKKRQVSEKFNMTYLVDLMLGRLRSLQEDELTSLATIVATCGLNAALVESERSKQPNLPTAAGNNSEVASDSSCRTSSFATGAARNSNLDGQMNKKTDETQLPSLDKFLVKRLTRLEREVLEAKKKNEAGDSLEKSDKPGHRKLPSAGDASDLGSILLKPSSKFEKEIEEAKKNFGAMFEKKRKTVTCEMSSSEIVPDLGSMLVKHSSKLEKEIEESRRMNEKFSDRGSKKLDGVHRTAFGCQKQVVVDVPSLDKVLVKHLSRLEKEVQEAKDRSLGPTDGCKVSSLSKAASLVTPSDDISLCTEESVGKENINTNRNEDSPEIFVPTLISDNEVQRHRKKHGGNANVVCEGLDKILVKHVTRLEKEKMGLHPREEEMVMKVKRRDSSNDSGTVEGSLDQVLVKHKSRLEREKMAAAQQPDPQIRHSVSRQEAREKELQEAWGGLSLGNSMRPHVSRLQRDKAAWLKAEQEEKRREMEAI